MSSRRGFLGALFGGAAATAGGLLIPKGVAASEKIEVSATPSLAEAIRSSEENNHIIACESADIPDDFFKERTNLYMEWWSQASPAMWRMSDEKYTAFIKAHKKINKDYGIFPEDADDDDPFVEGTVGALSPYAMRNLRDKYV